MKRKTQSEGTIVLFLETELKEAHPFSSENMSELQKQIFERMSEEEQMKVMEGYGTLIVDLESEKTICEFNMEHYRPPQFALDSLARALLPSIQEFYSHEENFRKFEEWQEERNQAKKAKR